MAEPEEDLLRKADALMARHRPQAGRGHYAEIPVLHEVVDPGLEVDDLPVLTELVQIEHRHIAQPEVPAQSMPDDAADPGLEGNAEPALTEPVEIENPSNAQRDALAQSMRASLLAVLQPEIDTLVEARLTERLEPLVEKLFFDLRSELQLIAHDALTKAIDGAVEREIERRNSGG